MLARILEAKRQELRELNSRLGRRGLAEMRRRAQAAPPPPDFIAALRDCPHVAVIAEIKRRSPSAGVMGDGMPLADRARAYAQGGAAAVSVLTDGPFFGGCLEDLRQARLASGLPALRKDFILEPLQLFQAKIAGASAVLLIAAALEPGRLRELFQTTTDLDMAALVEIHCAEELEAALTLKPSLVGINNRDLATLEVDLETCLRLRPLAPPEVLVAAESGVAGREDIDRLRAGGLDAFLVGTLLMRAEDPRGALRGLTQKRKEPTCA